jgi:hypothetical protein
VNNICAGKELGGGAGKKEEEECSTQAHKELRIMQSTMRWHKF